MKMMKIKLITIKAICDYSLYLFLHKATKVWKCVSALCVNSGVEK